MLDGRLEWDGYVLDWATLLRRGLVRSLQDGDVAVAHGAHAGYIGQVEAEAVSLEEGLAKTYAWIHEQMTSGARDEAALAFTGA